MRTQSGWNRFGVLLFVGLLATSITVFAQAAARRSSSTSMETSWEWFARLSWARASNDKSIERAAELWSVRYAAQQLARKGDVK